MTISVKFSFSWLNGFREDVHMDFCGNNSQFAYSVKFVKILYFIEKKQPNICLTSQYHVATVPA
jgi:hypothetical protein